MNTLRSLGSDEQFAKWGQLGKNFQIIATYAQTELGHGEPDSAACSVQTAQLQGRVGGGIHSQITYMLIWKHPSRWQSWVSRKEFLFQMCTHTLYELPKEQDIPFGSISMHSYVLTQSTDKREKGLQSGAHLVPH